MGDSGRPAGATFTFQEHRKYLFGLWEHLGLGDDVVLVVHADSRPWRGHASYRSTANPQRSSASSRSTADGRKTVPI
jgi:hypothetical protein